ncbi:unnamed protein product [Paramecium sonneborni]|uniref:Uncharacterized protein n=1 Tax=Paramecium sonneborni TaxID=65129 RepID=A0A8S1NQB5_9CILI|nr:unnamed protein product [Paramecium sonneborni]
MKSNQDQDIIIEELIEVDGKQSYWNGQFFLQRTIYLYQIIQGIEIYIKDGLVVKKQKVMDPFCKSQINLNFPQVKYLIWDGKYGDKNQKVGQWKAFWKSNQLKVGGLYDDNGLKQGNWIDIGQEYWDECKITYQGFYKDGIKIGKWDIVQENQICGGGQYAENNQQKIGNWVELYDNYWNQCQITQVGEYKNGKRIGRWDYKIENNIIGGGVYDHENFVKLGKWIELYSDFTNYCQLIQKGEYENGIKCGEWEILFREYSNDEFKIIGLEIYNQDQNQEIQKIELHKNFNQWCQILFKGTIKKEKRFGKWETFYRYSSNHQFQKIGGGFYDIQNGKKHGKWIEVYEHFKTDLCEVVYIGEYINGRKIGRWDIQFRVDSDKEFEIIGGGLYDDLNGKKQGEWIDLFENFNRDWCQIKYKGMYNNGIKYGNWNIYFRTDFSEDFELIGGGNYNHLNGLKHGKWLDQHPNFNCHYQIMLKGIYNNGEQQGSFTQIQLE